MTGDLSTDFERLTLPLDEPFTISRGTTETTENVLVRIEDGEHVGVGAAAPSTRYGETADTVEAVMPHLLEVVTEVGDPQRLGRIERRLRDVVRGNPAARTGVSVALHDLVTKRLDLPLYCYLALDPDDVPPTSYTVGLADPDHMAEKAEAAVAAGYDVLKVKVDADRPVEPVAAVREVAPKATIRVDANEAWTPREALSAIERLATHDVAFVEQPVPAEDETGVAFVHERAELPIAVDESCLTASDVPAVADRSDVVVVKLMKTGGIREAIETIHTAHAHDLEVMLGCMVETNAAIAASHHLAPLVEYADLDGALLLADDPFEGVPIEDGHVDLAALDRPGTGAVEREDW